MLLLTAAITHGITEVPREKKLSFSVLVGVCIKLMLSTSFGTWSRQKVSKGQSTCFVVFLVQLLQHIFHPVSMSGSILHQVCLPSFSLSFVFLVICIRFSPQIHSCLLQSIFVFCCLYLCLPLCASRRGGMYALSYHHGYASQILSSVLAICICLFSQVQVCSIRVMAAPPPIDSKPQPAEPEARSATRGKSICRDWRSVTIGSPWVRSFCSQFVMRFVCIWSIRCSCCGVLLDVWGV